MTDRFSGLDTGRNEDGRFGPGNPGRPKGARNRATMAVMNLLDGSSEKLTEKAVELALEGDVSALRICIERLAPPRKDAPVSFDLPEMSNASEAAQGAGAVLSAVSSGEITPIEGATIMGLIENYRRVLEASEFEARLSALEAKK